MEEIGILASRTSITICAFCKSAVRLRNATTICPGYHDSAWSGSGGGGTIDSFVWVR